MQLFMAVNLKEQITWTGKKKKTNRRKKNPGIAWVLLGFFMLGLAISGLMLVCSHR